MHHSLMHFVPVRINGQPCAVYRINSVSFMRSLMKSAPQLRPDVAQRAEQARVVFGD